MMERKLMIVGAVLLAAAGICFMAAVGMLLRVWMSSKGEIKAFYDENGQILEGSIAEKTFVEINGRKNGMVLRGRDADNPVLLFISGGPGVPQYWMNEYYENKLEDYFTVCWWDYYGEGLSYDASLMGSDITLEQLQKDAVAVVEYLKGRFGKDKVYLMAHSGGSMLGLRLAQNCPEQFCCYFAMGQVVEDRYIGSYFYLKEQFEAAGDQKGLKLLEKHIREKDGEAVIYQEKGIAGDWEKALLRAGCATTRDMRSDFTGIFLPQMFSNCYTFPEKLDYWRGKAVCQSSAYADTAITTEGEVAAEIPVYFLSGRYDYTCPLTLVEELYQSLDAPEKKLYIFEDSAHSPLWEENEAVLEVMRRELRS